MEAKNCKRSTKPMALLLCLALACAVWALAAVAYAAPPEDGAWRLVWRDEFDGVNYNGKEYSPHAASGLDLSNWAYQTGTGARVTSEPNWFWPGAGWGNNEMQNYQPEYSKVEGGVLTITATPQEGKTINGATNSGNTYWSSKLRTYQTFSQTYGRFEASISLPLAEGFWPAFWMLPATTKYGSGSSGSWPTDGEIDIMEAKCAYGYYTSGALHRSSTSSSSNMYNATNHALVDGTTINGFHLYALEWEPTEMRWYVDGDLYQVITAAQWNSQWYRNQGHPATAPFDQPFNMILNLAVGGNFDNPKIPGEDGGPMTAQMKIDYIRVYERNEGVVDTAAIVSAINQFERKDQSWYTAATWSAAAEACVAAKAALADSEATQATIDGARDSLRAADAALRRATQPGLGLPAEGDVICLRSVKNGKLVSAESTYFNTPTSAQMPTMSASADKLTAANERYVTFEVQYANDKAYLKAMNGSYVTLEDSNSSANTYRKVRPRTAAMSANGSESLLFELQGDGTIKILRSASTTTPAGGTLYNDWYVDVKNSGALQSIECASNGDSGKFEWVKADELDLWADAEFDLNVDVLEWGSATTAVIIDMTRDVDAADVDIDTFLVTAETRNPTNNAVVYNGPRTVTGAYVSATAEKGKPAERGRYVVLELKYGFNNTAAEVNGCAALNYLSSRNYWLNQNYTVTQDKAIGAITGSTLAYGKTVTPIYDDFILTGNPVEPYTSQTYRVYTPKGAAGPLPLVLWNHGAGETFGTSSGASNEGSQLFANMGGIGWVKNAPEDCVVIAPQRSLNGYSQAGVIAFIQDLVDKGVVDGNRIYVSGCSMGGQETDNFLIAYPSFFAAAIPICPAGSVSAAQAATIAAGGLPVWIVNAANDPTVNNNSVTTMYNNMISGGVDAYRTVFADVRGTEIPNADYATATYNGHWSWVMVLNNIDDIGAEARGPFMDWLFAQTRQVQVGIEAPAELDVDLGQDLGYSVTMRREMAGTNMAEITVAFDAAKLDYVGSDVKIPGWSFMSAPAVDPVAGTYHAYVWAGVAGEPLFTTYAAAEVLSLGFKAKSHLTYKDVVEAALVSAKVSEKQADGLFYAAAAKLDPASAATAIIDHMRFDVNGDGKIDIADVSTVLYYYYLQRIDSCDFWYTDLEIPLAGGGVTLLPPARLLDPNGDGIIDLGDILIICSYF